MGSSISTRSVWGDTGLSAIAVPSSPQTRTSSPGTTGGNNSPKDPYPYLMALPGLDPAYIQEKFPELLQTSVSRPESRTAASASNTAGGIARRQRSHGQGNGGDALLPEVDMATTGRRASPVFLKEKEIKMDEEEFPPAPSQSAEPVMFLPGAAARRPKAVSRSSLTKQGIEVTPYYTEVVTNVYKYPLLIALLTSARLAPPPPSANNRLHTASLQSRSRDPDDYSQSVDLHQSSVFGSRSETHIGFDRLVVKVYDVMGCAEYLIHANISEYISFRAELDEKYDNNAFRHFHPEDKNWWSANIRNLLRVQLKRNGQLHMTISKTSIDEVVLAAIHKEQEEKHVRKTTRNTRRTSKRPSTLSKQQLDTDLPHRVGPPSNIIPAPISRFHTFDSVKTVAPPMSLENDYDYDFDP